MTNDEAVEFMKARVRWLAGISGGLTVVKEYAIAPGQPNVNYWQIAARVDFGDIPGNEVPGVTFPVIQPFVQRYLDNPSHLQDYIDQQWTMAMISLWNYCNKDLNAANKRRFEEVVAAEEAVEKANA